MKHFFLFFVCSIALYFISKQTIAQNVHNQHWVFGHNAAVDFRTNPPTVDSFVMRPPNVIYSALEADANACNAFGQVVLYSNGTQVFDRLQSQLPNGNNLVPLGNISLFTPTNSSSQGTMIVPVPDNPNRYYVFSLTCMEMLANYGRLYYSLVDLSLNGGRGDVVFGQKGILVDSNLTEHMTSMVGLCTDNAVWLVAVSKRRKALIAYRIDRYGINRIPVVSPLQHDIFQNTNTGTLVPNLAQDKLIFSSYISEREGGVGVFDFNKATGEFTNERLLDSNSSYSSCFAPDGNKVYYTSFGDLYQMDLAAGSLNNIRASRNVIYNGLGLTDLKLANDRKIYFKSPTTRSALAALLYPNNTGATVDVKDSAIMLMENTFVHYGLPNYVADLSQGIDTILTRNVLYTCKDTRVELKPLKLGNIAYKWNDNTQSNTLYTDQEGTYWVTYYWDCDVHVDTFELRYYNNYPDTIVINDTICDNEYYLFGQTKLNEAGSFFKKFKSHNDCDSNVQLNLHLRAQPVANFTVDIDAQTCFGDQFSIQVHGFNRQELYWNNNLIDSLALNNKTINSLENNFKLIVTDSASCKDTMYKIFHVNLCCDVFVPSAFSPNNDGLNDVFKPIDGNKTTDLEFSVFDRFGTRVYFSKDASPGWNGLYNNKPCDLGVYYWMLKGKCLDGSTLKKTGDVTLIR